MTDALYIRLVAPFYWRVENVMKKKNTDIETAEEFAVDSDEKRFNLIRTFLDKKPLNIDYLFDVTINRSPFTIHDTAELIVSMYEKKICRQITARKKLSPEPLISTNLRYLSNVFAQTPVEALFVCVPVCYWILSHAAVHRSFSNS